MVGLLIVRMFRYGGFSFDIGGSEATVNVSDVKDIMEALFPTPDLPTEPDDLAVALEDILDEVNIHENIKVKCHASKQENL